MDDDNVWLDSRVAQSSKSIDDDGAASADAWRERVSSVNDAASGESGFVVMEFVVFVLLVLVFVVMVKLLLVVVVVTEDESECGDCAENGMFGAYDWTGVNGSWFCCW